MTNNICGDKTHNFTTATTAFNDVIVIIITTFFNLFVQLRVARYPKTSNLKSVFCDCEVVDVIRSVIAEAGPTKVCCFAKLAEDAKELKEISDRSLVLKRIRAWNQMFWRPNSLLLENQPTRRLQVSDSY